MFPSGFRIFLLLVVFEFPIVVFEDSYFYNCSSLYLCFQLEFIFLYSLFTGFLCPAAIPISVFVGSSLCLCFRLDFIPLYLYFTERILQLTTIFDLHKNASLHVISIL